MKPLLSEVRQLAELGGQVTVCLFQCLIPVQISILIAADDVLQSLVTKLIADAGDQCHAGYGVGIRKLPVARVGQLPVMRRTALVW